MTIPFLLYHIVFDLKLQGFFLGGGGKCNTKLKCNEGVGLRSLLQSYVFFWAFHFYRRQHNYDMTLKEWGKKVADLKGGAANVATISLVAYSWQKLSFLANLGVHNPLFFWGGDGKCPILSCILFEIFRIRPTGTTCHAHCICIVIGTERFRYTSYDVPLNYQVSTLAVNWKEKIQTCPPPSPWIFVFRPASVRG